MMSTRIRHRNPSQSVTHVACAKAEMLENGEYVTNTSRPSVTDFDGRKAIQYIEIMNISSSISKYVTTPSRATHVRVRVRARGCDGFPRWIPNGGLLCQCVVIVAASSAPTHQRLSQRRSSSRLKALVAVETAVVNRPSGANARWPASHSCRSTDGAVSSHQSQMMQKVNIEWFLPAKMTGDAARTRRGVS